MYVCACVWFCFIRCLIFTGSVLLSPSTMCVFVCCAPATTSAAHLSIPPNGTPTWKEARFLFACFLPPFFTHHPAVLCNLEVRLRTGCTGETIAVCFSMELSQQHARTIMGQPKGYASNKWLTACVVLCCFVLCLVVMCGWARVHVRLNLLYGHCSRMKQDNKSTLSSSGITNCSHLK